MSSAEANNHTKLLLFSQALFWLSLALFFLLGIAFLFEVQANDFWWYMRVARDTLADGAIPQVDTLSFTHAGQPIVYHSWLSAMIFYLTFQAGGLPWIVVLRVLSVLAMLVILWGLLYRTGLDPILSAGLLFVAGLTTSNNWLTIRPQIFILPLFLLILWVLTRWDEKNKRVVWFLPLISVFWVNLHGSFILIAFLVIPALFFGKGERKYLFYAFAISVLIFAINPRGFEVWDYVWKTLTLSSSQSVSYEWAPPANIGWQMNLFYAWLLVFTPLVAFSPGRLTRLDWIWFLSFGWMAFSGLRYVVWFTLLLAIWTARLLVAWNYQPLKYVSLHNVKLNFILAGFLLILPLFLMPGMRERWWEQAPSALPDSTPIAAVEWLAEQPDLPGELWSELGFASYLTYVLPERPMWIDLRFEMIYSVDDWDEYALIVNADPGWDEILRRDDVNLIFISYNSTQLLSVLKNSVDWCQVYQDDVSIIFSRKTTDGACMDG